MHRYTLANAGGGGGGGGGGVSERGSSLTLMKTISFQVRGDERTLQFVF